MNKKGEVGKELGMIIIVAIALVVGAILFQVIAQEVGSSTNTIVVSNESLGAKIANSTPQYITNYRALSSVEVFNESNDEEVIAGFFTITNNVIHPTTGALCVNITPAAAVPENYTSIWQISGTGQPLTYLPDSASRSMAGLIVIFFALAVAVIALTPTLRSGVLGALGKIGS